MEPKRYPLLVVSIGCIGGGAYGVIGSLRRCRDWLPAEGIVVGYDEHEGLYAPKVQFTAFDGCSRVFVSRLYEDQNIPIGGNIRIRYSPERPEEAEVASFNAFWLFPLIWLLFGIVLLSMTILIPPQGHSGED